MTEARQRGKPPKPCRSSTGHRLFAALHTCALLPTVAACAARARDNIEDENMREASHHAVGVIAGSVSEATGWRVIGVAVGPVETAIGTEVEAESIELSSVLLHRDVWRDR